MGRKEQGSGHFQTGKAGDMLCGAAVVVTVVRRMVMVRVEKYL